MDAAAVDDKAFGVVRRKELHRFPLTRAGTVAVNVAVLHANIPAVAQGDGAVAALIDAAGCDRKVAAFQSVDADGPAAEKPAAGDGTVQAVFQAEHAAGAEAGFQCVPGGQVSDRQVPAADKADHVGVARHGGNGGFAKPRAAEREAFHILDHQFRMVLSLLTPDAVPGVIRAVGILAVIGSGAEVIFARSKLNHGVRGNGGQQFVHICHTDRIAVRCGGGDVGA